MSMYEEWKADTFMPSCGFWIKEYTDKRGAWENIAAIYHPNERTGLYGWAVFRPNEPSSGAPYATGEATTEEEARRTCELALFALNGE